MAQGCAALSTTLGEPCLNLLLARHNLAERHQNLIDIAKGLGLDDGMVLRRCCLRFSWCRRMRCHVCSGSGTGTGSDSGGGGGGGGGGSISGRGSRGRLAGLAARVNQRWAVFVYDEKEDFFFLKKKKKKKHTEKSSKIKLLIKVK